MTLDLTLNDLANIARNASIAWLNRTKLQGFSVFLGKGKRAEKRDWLECRHEYYNEALENKIHELYQSRAIQYDANTWKKTKDNIVPKGISSQDYEAGTVINKLIYAYENFYHETVKNKGCVDLSAVFMESALEEIESRSLQLLDDLPIKHLRMVYDEWKGNQSERTVTRVYEIMDIITERSGFEPLTKVAPKATSNPLSSMRP
jgi:hypothetical protein